MDQFQDGQLVCLRSRVHGTYLHADEDGHGVSLNLLLTSMNSVWVVQRNHGEDQHVLLYSAAYGRYLAATATSAPLGCSGFRVEQSNYENARDRTIRWHAIKIRQGDDFLLLCQAAADRNRYLRANGKHLRWNEGVVSVDHSDDISSMMEWVLVPIASTERVPRPPRPNRLCPRLTESLAVLLSSRVVEFAETRLSFVFSGRSLLQLKNEVASRLGISDALAPNLPLCVRAGRHGRFTPLVVDLPRSGQDLTITVWQPGNIILRYPDFDVE